MQCSHIVKSAASFNLRFDPARPARDGLRIDKVCVTCGHLPDLTGLALHPLDRAALRAAAAIGTSGDAVEMGFPTMSELAADAVGAALLIRTNSDHRIDGTVKTMTRTYVLGLLKHRMPFRQDAWPRAVDCPGLDHPVILHTGLREKFADRRDADHVRFAYYSRSVIAHPVEIWQNEDGRLKYSILGSLAAGSRLHHMLVVAEADNHICDTAYVVDRPERIEGYRRGRLIYAGWRFAA